MSRLVTFAQKGHKNISSSLHCCLRLRDRRRRRVHRAVPPPERALQCEPFGEGPDHAKEQLIDGGVKGRTTVVASETELKTATPMTGTHFFRAAQEAFELFIPRDHHDLVAVNELLRQF